ncbi:MAG: VOC family protein [Pseudomonadota bacterium]
MIGYVMVGTNDLARSTAFYDELMKEFGAGRFMESDAFVAWGTGPNDVGFSVTKPADGNAASVGNGVMVALVVDSKEKVHTVYQKALDLGGTCEGKPGPRGGGGFYAGYFRDLDGNKLNVFTMNG